MKNLKIKLSLLALIVGLGSAFATVQPHQLTLKRWAFDPLSQTYIDISELSGEDYQCSTSDNVCTADYPDGVNPNDQDHDSYPGTAPASDLVHGDFAE